MPRVSKEIENNVLIHPQLSKLIFYLAKKEDNSNGVANRNFGTTQPIIYTHLKKLEKLKFLISSQKKRGAYSVNFHKVTEEFINFSFEILQKTLNKKIALFEEAVEIHTKGESYRESLKELKDFNIDLQKLKNSLSSSLLLENMILLIISDRNLEFEITLFDEFQNILNFLFSYDFENNILDYYTFKLLIKNKALLGKMTGKDLKIRINSLTPKEKKEYDDLEKKVYLKIKNNSAIQDFNKFAKLIKKILKNENNLRFESSFFTSLDVLEHLK